MAKRKPITEGQRYLIEWALSLPFGRLCWSSDVPCKAPIGVSMSALRGLQRRGLFVEYRPGFFWVTDAAKAYTTLDRVNSMRRYFGLWPQFTSLDDAATYR